MKIPHLASVAQLVEQRTENPCVVGSIPTGGTTNADVAHLVERHLAKVEVASSSLVIRSRKEPSQTRWFFFEILSEKVEKAIDFSPALMYNKSREKQNKTHGELSELVEGARLEIV